MYRVQPRRRARWLIADGLCSWVPDKRSALSGMTARDKRSALPGRQQRVLALGEDANAKEPGLSAGLPLSSIKSV